MDSNEQAAIAALLDAVNGPTGPHKKPGFPGALAPGGPSTASSGSQRLGGDHSFTEQVTRSLAHALTANNKPYEPYGYLPLNRRTRRATLRGATSDAPAAVSGSTISTGQP
ncbi:hypothetical protein GCM10010294_20060 [Streptomyces griseoloalbus]|nr:hypothetical protein GCM10010294_20060 [Streptomyces griseoloalbus]